MKTLYCTYLPLHIKIKLLFWNWCSTSVYFQLVHSDFTESQQTDGANNYLLNLYRKYAFFIEAKIWLKLGFKINIAMVGS